MAALGELETGFDFTVPPELSAHAPAEARGLARDGVRMLVGHRAGPTVEQPTVEHRAFTDLSEVLRPGDLLVVNNSGTLPAALPARLPDGTPVALHLSSAHPVCAAPTWSNCAGPLGRPAPPSTSRRPRPRPARASCSPSLVADRPC